jgi:hypothetical protein
VRNRSAFSEKPRHVGTDSPQFAVELADLLQKLVHLLSAARPCTHHAPEPDRALRLDEAASLLAMSHDFVYRNWKRLGGYKDADHHIKFRMPISSGTCSGRPRRAGREGDREDTGRKRGDGTLIRVEGQPNWFSLICVRGKQHEISTGTPDLKLAKRFHRQKLDELAADRQGLKPFTTPQHLIVTELAAAETRLAVELALISHDREP